MPVIVTECSSTPEVCSGQSLVPPYQGRQGLYRMHDSARSVEAVLVNEELFTQTLNSLYSNIDVRNKFGEIAKMHSKQFDFDSSVMPLWLDLFKNIDPNVILTREVLGI